MSRTSAAFRSVRYSNGQMPARFLKRVHGKHGSSRSLNAYVRRDAANAFNRASAEGKRKGLGVLTLRGWYRSIGEQRRVRARLGNIAAYPGYSNHGLGTAIDIDNFGGVGDFDNARRKAWAPILRKHGFTDDEGRKSNVNEPWHWDYDPAKDKGKNAPTRDWLDMVSERELRKIIRSEVVDIVKFHPTVQDPASKRPVSHREGMRRIITLLRRIESRLKKLEGK